MRHTSSTAASSFYRAHHEHLASLLQEGMRSERWTERRCRRELRQLVAAGPDGPIVALKDCILHARVTLRELERFAERDELRTSATRVVVSAAVGWLANRVASVLGSMNHRERSYRLMLLGLRQGLDTMQAMRLCAEACGEVEIAALATGWLAERGPAVEGVERGLRWFAHRPELARGQRRTRAAIVSSVRA